MKEYRMFRNIIKAQIQLPSRLFFIAAAACLVFTSGTFAQPATQPTPEEYYNGYKVTAVTEFGWRFRSLDGNENKYRSDLNYKSGFRSFDSNILFESDTGKGKYFDSLLIM